MSKSNNNNNQDKSLHKVSLRVFIKEDEDYENIRSTFLLLFPFDTNLEKIEVKEEQASTFKEKKITILSVDLLKQKHIKLFLNSFLSNINNSKQLLIEQLDSRVDQDNIFYIRFDKQSLINNLNNIKYEIVDHGDCFHISLHIATYPKDREKAKQKIKELLEK